MELPDARLVPGFDSGNGTRVQTARITCLNSGVLPKGPDQSDIGSNALNRSFKRKPLLARLP